MLVRTMLVTLAVVAAQTAPTTARATTAPTTAAPASIEFSPCPEELGAPRGTGCATLDVPLDHAQPDGKKITLTLAAAGSRSAPEVLVVNPGGPGASGIDVPKQIWSQLPPELQDRYLVISWDTRGVGASSPVSCGDTSDLRTRPQPPYRSADSEQKRVDIAREVAARCAEKSGDLLPHITTENSARDLDRIRAGLGREKIDYLGYSYGTLLGATYLTLFPNRVGRAVLDSVVDPTTSNYESGFAQNAALQKRAEQFFAWTAARDETYHLGKTAADVEKTWQETRAKLEAQPAGDVVGSAELDDLLASAMYVDSSWPSLADPVARYVGGDANGLISASNSLGIGAVNPPQLAFNCVDGAWPKDWQTWHDDTARSDRKAPLFAWLNTWYSAPCAFWQAPAVKTVEIGADRPVLLVQAKHDGPTPEQGAHRMQDKLKGSRLVLADSGNHGQFLFDGNACVNQAAASYLSTGTLPGKDIDCPAPTS